MSHEELRLGANWRGEFATDIKLIGLTVKLLQQKSVCSENQNRLEGFLVTVMPSV